MRIFRRNLEKTLKLHPKFGNLIAHEGEGLWLGPSVGQGTESETILLDLDVEQVLQVQVKTLFWRHFLDNNESVSLKFRIII
jgi:hypothetical protein